MVRDFGINTEHFTSGREEAVAQFAVAVGLPVEVIKRASIRVFQRGAFFRGEDISKPFLSRVLLAIVLLVWRRTVLGGIVGSASFGAFVT